VTAALSDGGAIYLEPAKSISIRAFAGRGCSAIDECSFGWFHVDSNDEGFLQFNDSSGISGNCGHSTFHTFCGENSRKIPIGVLDLNSSLNSAVTWASAIDIGERRGVQMLYSRFYSNGVCNMFVLYISEEMSEICYCLEFYNNSVTSGDEYKGLISVFCNFQFTDCVFMNNNVDALVGKHPNSEGLVVKLVRCIFNDWPTWGTLNVVLETQSCIKKDDIGFPMDFGVCAVNPDFYCLRYECDGNCPSQVEIADCVFYRLGSDQIKGGAVSVSNQQCTFRLLRCQFFQCRANTEGGSVRAYCLDITVLSFFGVESAVSGHASNCDLQARNSQTERNQLNESTALQGSGPYGTFHIHFSSYQDGMGAVISSVNATLNQGTGSYLPASVLLLTQSRLHITQFCQFYSNYPYALVCLSDVSAAIEGFRCIDFVNNTHSGSNGDTGSLIFSAVNCSFRDCFFVKNSGEWLAGCFSHTSPLPTIIFLDCVFDADMKDSFNSVVLELISCDVRNDPTILIDRPTCPAMAATPTPAASPDPTVSETPIPTPVPSVTDTPNPSVTETPVPSVTETPLPSVTETPVPSVTETPFPSVTETPLPSVSDTPTPSPIATPSIAFRASAELPATIDIRHSASLAETGAWTLSDCFWASRTYLLSSPISLSSGFPSTTDLQFSSFFHPSGGFSDSNSYFLSQGFGNSIGHDASAGFTLSTDWPSSNVWKWTNGFGATSFLSNSQAIQMSASLSETGRFNLSPAILPSGSLPISAGIVASWTARASDVYTTSNGFWVTQDFSMSERRTASAGVGHSRPFGATRAWDLPPDPTSSKKFVASAPIVHSNSIAETANLAESELAPESSVLPNSAPIGASQPIDFSGRIGMTQVINPTNPVPFSRVNLWTEIFMPESKGLRRTKAFDASRIASLSQKLGATFGLDVSIMLESMPIENTKPMSRSAVVDPTDHLSPSGHFSHSDNVIASNAIGPSDRFDTAAIMVGSVFHQDSDPLTASSKQAPTSGLSRSSDFHVTGQVDASESIANSRRIAVSEPFARSAKPPKSFVHRQSRSHGHSSEGAASAGFSGSAVVGDLGRGKGSPSEPSFLWIGIGAAFGVLVLAGIVALLLLFVRRRQTTNPERAIAILTRRQQAKLHIGNLTCPMDLGTTSIRWSFPTIQRIPWMPSRTRWERARACRRKDASWQQ
jgi:hypothetical protein